MDIFGLDMLVILGVTTFLQLATLFLICASAGLVRWAIDDRGRYSFWQIIIISTVSGLFLTQLIMWLLAVVSQRDLGSNFSQFGMLAFIWAVSFVSPDLLIKAYRITMDKIGIGEDK